MLKIEMLTVETVGALKPLLLELADYHNQTALNFRGLYPLVCADEKIRTLPRRWPCHRRQSRYGRMPRSARR